jgi:hypothetical protein
MPIPHPLLSLPDPLQAQRPLANHATTPAGLSVHMNQVHKESLDQVENALPNRNGLDTEIFGMEGVPEEVIAQHSQRIIQSYYQEQAERFAATGNPPPGSRGTADGQRPVKKIRVESKEETLRRLREFRDRVKARKAGLEQPPAQGGPGDAMQVDGRSPGQSVSLFSDGLACCFASHDIC